jgi:glutathione S-transferase
MKLFVSGPSPFVRKVLVCAHERGIALEQEEVKQSPLAPSPSVAAYNPLGKIPSLLLDDGTALFDSRVICEYFDTLGHGASLIPPADRWHVLRTQALADGMLDAGVLIRYERALRPAERQWPEWLEGQARKIRQALESLTTEPPRGFDLGAIAVACALGWLEFRQVLPELRSEYGALCAWYDELRQRPSFVATEPRE